MVVLLNITLMTSVSDKDKIEEFRKKVHNVLGLNKMMDNIIITTASSLIEFIFKKGYTLVLIDFESTINLDIKITSGILLLPTKDLMNENMIYSFLENELPSAEIVSIEEVDFKMATSMILDVLKLYTNPDNYEIMEITEKQVKVIERNTGVFETNTAEIKIYGLINRLVGQLVKKERESSQKDFDMTYT